METRYFGSYASQIGPIYVVCTDSEVIRVDIGEEDFFSHQHSALLVENMEHPLVSETLKQLDEYFHGKRKAFQLPLYKKGTVFQQSVWTFLETIPFGETKSYHDVAVAIGNAKAVRAIGQANKANQLPIIVPCHRVIGKNRSLTGYAGTRTDIKEVLLTLEGAQFKK